MANAKEKKEFIDSLRGRRVMVVGMASSGIAAGALLLEIGAKPVLYDAKTEFELGELADKCELALGGDANAVAESCDMLVLSPGVPTRLDFIQTAMKSGKPVISEIELGYMTSEADFVCIGGTNGKTTTTSLTGEIFKNAGRNTFVLGNIGIPITEHSLETKPGDVIVAETAALQLETIDKFHPRSCALLNITEDHMDRFGTMEYYAQCKVRMFENQTQDDFGVLNYDEPATAAQCFQLPSRVLWFSRKTEVDQGAFIKNGRIVYKQDDKEIDICAPEEIYIPGDHNLENALAAVCLAASMGVSADIIAHTLRTFKGVEHRIEFVCERDGIRFVNDSKGTNPDATIKAVLAMKTPTVLLLGGFDKHSEFEPMFEDMTENIKAVVLMGETRQKLFDAAQKAGFKGDVILADGFEAAVEKATERAEAGYTVLLSPACASWGMFTNFEERGRVFKQLVSEGR